MNMDFEFLIEDAETLERAADIIRRESVKRRIMTDVLINILTRMAVNFRSRARELDRKPKS